MSVTLYLYDCTSKTKPRRNYVCCVRLFGSTTFIEKEWQKTWRQKGKTRTEDRKKNKTTTDQLTKPAKPALTTKATYYADLC